MEVGKQQTLSLSRSIAFSTLECSASRNLCAGSFFPPRSSITSGFQALLLMAFNKFSDRICSDSSIRSMSKTSSGWETCSDLHDVI